MCFRCVQVIDTDKFDVVVVSPRNHFIFTPMLPSSAVGTVDYRSLLEPVRISNPYARYIEASCEVCALSVSKSSANLSLSGCTDNMFLPRPLLGYQGVHT